MGRNRIRDDDWAEAKRLCRLSEEELRMARELGLNPRKLIKNIPSPGQRWKAPVGEWVCEMYRERHRARLLEEPSSRPPREEPDEDAFEETGDDNGSWAEPELTWHEEIAEQDSLLRRRQDEFRAAAAFVTAALARLPFVERVVLFGSVAQPLRREVPRFRRFRRAGVVLWHECKDVDLAVWLSDWSQLKKMQKARGNALNDLFALAAIGIAHHQVDVFLFEPRSDRYLGRLCHFGMCPKGKPECRAPGCGAALFLRQHENFVFDPRSLDSARSTLLFDRASSFGPPSLDRWMDDLPF